MYSVTETQDNKILFKLQGCRKKFIVNGEFVKFNRDGIAKVPKDVTVFVHKIDHWTLHQVRMAKNRQILYHNSTIEQHDLGEKLKLDEEEILKSSLELIAKH